MPFPGNVPLWSTNPTRAAGGRRGADTPNVGTPQMGPAPLRWKQVLPLEIPAIASTLQWEDGIWTQSSHVAKKVLGPCLVLCPLHAMAREGFLENSATQTPSHMSWMSRERSAHKPPSQPYLALPSDLWQAQLMSTSVHLQSRLLKWPHLYASHQAIKLNKYKYERSTFGKVSTGHTGAAWLCLLLGSASQRRGAPSPWKEDRSSLKVSGKIRRMQHNCTCLLLIQISSPCHQISVHRSTAKGKLRHAMTSCPPRHRPEQNTPTQPQPCKFTVKTLLNFRRGRMDLAATSSPSLGRQAVGRRPCRCAGLARALS